MHQWTPVRREAGQYVPRRIDPRAIDERERDGRIEIIQPVRISGTGQSKQNSGRDRSRAPPERNFTDCPERRRQGSAGSLRKGHPNLDQTEYNESKNPHP
jgi:hypothetical protein